jgi:hypothetical protein
MGTRWLPWGGRWREERRDQGERAQRRERERARPRVTQAAVAARLAREGVISAPRFASAGRHLDAIERATATRPLVTGTPAKTARRAERGLPSQLVLATARAARETGRLPEEVWAEALRDWLARLEDATTPRPAVVQTRRQTVWRDIEETLRALRAS